MGNHNFTPRRAFKNNEPVGIKGCSYSREHVANELQKFGRGGYATKTAVMYQSRQNAPKIYVTKVKFRNGKDELFLTNDLCPPNELGSGPITSTAKRSGSGYNTGSRVVNSRMR